MSVTADKAMSGASYAGGAFSVAAGMTLTEWGVVVGIVTALLTFVANQVWQARKDRRQQRADEAADARAQRIHDLEVERLMIYGKPSRESLEAYSKSDGPRCE